MKKVLNIFFVILGVIFFIIILLGVYFYIADPLHLKPIIFGNEVSESASDDVDTHPLHSHGQRFVVLAEEGELNENMQWKDTVLIPKGQTVDLLAI